MDPSNMEIWIVNPSPRLLRQAKKLALIYPDRSLDALHFWTVKHSVNIYIHAQSRIFWNSWKYLLWPSCERLI